MVQVRLTKTPPPFLMGLNCPDELLKCFQGLKLHAFDPEDPPEDMRKSYQPKQGLLVSAGQIPHKLLLAGKSAAAEWLLGKQRGSSVRYYCLTAEHCEIVNATKVAKTSAALATA